MEKIENFEVEENESVDLTVVEDGGVKGFFRKHKSKIAAVSAGLVAGLLMGAALNRSHNDDDYTDVLVDDEEFNIEEI